MIAAADVRPPFALLEEDEEWGDSFAGGGGVGAGGEQAFGKPALFAINHDAAALAMHRANHPHTTHYRENVWQVDPVKACRGRKLGFFWLSPDCTHFSRAKGGKPLSRKIRALAHVAVRWAKAVRPRIIVLENVEEFLTWGPCIKGPDGKLRPDPKRRGQSFRRFVRQLEREGYVIDWRVLTACDFGVPTSRRRFFLVARCDGRPICWPEPTHGPGRLPYRTAAECIDWTLPCPSIFLTKAEAKALGFSRIKRPLADATLRRIARGIDRFVLRAARPFLVRYQSAKRAGDDRVADIDAPLPTLTAEPRFGLCVPTLVQTGYGERQGQAPRVPGLDKPLGTVIADGNKHALVSAFLAKHYGGNETPGADLLAPMSAITARDHHAVVASSLVKLYGSAKHGVTVDAPMPTVTAGGNHLAEVRAFLVAYYGTARDGQSVLDPMRTITSKDRLGLVTVHGVDYAIADIGMRMLSPRERFRAQGFPEDYVIDVRVPETGKWLTEEEQGAAVGNSVCPPLAAALIRAVVGVSGDRSPRSEQLDMLAGAAA